MVNSMCRVPQKHVFKDLFRCHTKRRISGLGPTNPSFYMTPTAQNNPLAGDIRTSMKAADYKSLVGIIPKEGLAGPRPPILLLF